jgi:hypothetical protein
VQSVGEISIDLIAYLRQERAKAIWKRTLYAKEEHTIIDVVLLFTMGSEKGVLKVSARSGNREVGATEIK